MQIVINISEETYKGIKNHVRPAGCIAEILDAISNGTPLPKGHGRLIDADALEYWKNNRPDEIGYHFVPKYEIDNVPTIIEADNAESED